MITKIDIVNRNIEKAKSALVALRQDMKNHMYRYVVGGTDRAWNDVKDVQARIDDYEMILAERSNLQQAALQADMKADRAAPTIGPSYWIDRWNDVTGRVMDTDTGAELEQIKREARETAVEAGKRAECEELLDAQRSRIGG